MGWRGYFVASAEHIRNFDVLVSMTRLCAQRWQMLSGKGRAGFKAMECGYSLTAWLAPTVAWADGKDPRHGP